MSDTRWFALYEITSGKLVSMATILPGVMREGLEYVELDSFPDLYRYCWNAEEKAFVLKKKPNILRRVKAGIKARIIRMILPGV